MSTSLTTAEIIASAPGRDIALEKRSIQMRMFKSKTNIQACVRDQVIVPLGQIAGVIYDVIEKPGTLPDGTQKTSLLAIGDFQATNYETGELIDARQAYLPGYFAEALRSLFVKGAARTAEILIEICAEPTGLDEKTGLPKAIPFAYGVKNLMAREASSPLERLKRRAMKQNATMLRLPAPLAEVETALPLDDRGEYWTPESGAQDLALTHDAPLDDTPDPALLAANAAVENSRPAAQGSLREGARKRA